ncbi:unnamed protein product [Arctia plantaginis]|uniref:GCN5-related N-acetyltransferase Rv2170-like domain-containing protein n=1 Tax=Arctia plantaginis TaxID=874455 RepID=A0A8S1AKS5_ARCPL|nr:unnamed protein product [Arctia plantaginis]
MNFKRFFVTRAKMFHLPGTTKPFTDYKLPDKTTMKSVKLEDIQRVDDAWDFKYPCSDIYFATLASNGLSYGLYSTETDELLAWMFINEYNYLCHLYCEEKQRRRGYGQYIMQCVVNNLLKDGNDVYGHVVDGNEMPLKIFAKFGFKLVDNAAFLTVENPLNKV